MAHAHTLYRTTLLLSLRRADTIRTWSTQVSFSITPRMISAQDTWNYGSLVWLWVYSPNNWLSPFTITSFGIWFKAMKWHVTSLEHLLRCSCPLPSPPLPAPPVVTSVVMNWMLPFSRIINTNVAQMELQASRLAPVHFIFPHKISPILWAHINTWLTTFVLHL